MKVYLAGPDVFLSDAMAMAERKRAICAAHGLIGLFPLDNAIERDRPIAAGEIFHANTDLMRQADAVIAHLTPFRGPSADAGTVYELGFMAGAGKLCAGYSNIPLTYPDKVRAELKSAAEAAFDRHGMMIEDFGLADNLMIVHALETFGIPLVLPRKPVEDPFRDLTGFEACVRLLAEHSARSQPA
ncbi:MAG TPA: nucleoside 2-deoxyribosyltransferase [Pseudolabrys sp.]|jgi:nucleoside 2-deoxyribosyltransferase|nr:nucleoside 2-deoxyribosyltransferase [Pseudolabrys sp.]